VAVGIPIDEIRAGREIANLQRTRGASPGQTARAARLGAAGRARAQASSRAIPVAEVIDEGGGGGDGLGVKMPPPWPRREERLAANSDTSLFPRDVREDRDTIWARTRIDRQQHSVQLIQGAQPGYSWPGGRAERRMSPQYHDGEQTQEEKILRIMQLMFDNGVYRLRTWQEHGVFGPPALVRRRPPHITILYDEAFFRLTGRESQPTRR